ncbi:MAG: hypothetical protein ACP5PQ_05220 [Thermoproteota archaeon]
MSSGEKAGEKASVKITGIDRRLLTFLPGLVLAATYVLAAVITGGEAYNLLIAGALIGASVCIRMFSDTMLKEIVRYMFLTGIVIGVAGVSPPLYFTILYGVLSSTELVLSIVCIILTALTIIRIKSLNVL